MGSILEKQFVSIFGPNHNDDFSNDSSDANENTMNSNFDIIFIISQNKINHQFEECIVN